MKPYQSTAFFKPETWFWLFLSAHLIGWSLVPALVRHNLPLDSIEGTLWGQQWQLGYDKNPFLNGWLTAVAGGLSHPSGWLIYVFSQLSVVLCFYAVWKIGKAVFTPALALVGVALLEGVQYYNFHAIDFNDNTLELSTWGLACYAFFLALRRNDIKYWVMLGFFAFLGMMAKYYTLVLLASMGLLLFYHRPYRRLLLTLPPYVGLITFVVLCAPHAVWLFHHNFITVRYVFERANSAPHWTNHLFFPLQFFWQQLEVFLPALVIYGLLFLGSTPRREKVVISRENQLFLNCVALGPLLLTMLLALVCGNKLRAGWGMPLQSFWPLWLLSVCAPRLSRQKLVAFLSGIFILLLSALIFYRNSLVHSPDASSANFPGQRIADTLTAEWNARFHTPLQYVAGSRWIGGNIEYYSKDHPAVFVEWSTDRAPWIHLKNLNQTGAIFVWDITDHETLPPEIIKAYPRLEPAKIRSFPLDRNEYHLPPQQIGVAILPPLR